MNRQTYPVYCGWRSALVRTDRPVKGSTGICPACAERARGMRNATPWTDEAAGERRALLDVPRRRGSDFLDGFLIGGAVATLLGILAEWLMHR